MNAFESTLKGVYEQDQGPVEGVILWRTPPSTPNLYTTCVQGSKPCPVDLYPLLDNSIP